MGIFDGTLLVSDFDNTLVYTEEALRLCVDMPPVSPPQPGGTEAFYERRGYLLCGHGEGQARL